MKEEFFGNTTVESTTEFSNTPETEPTSEINLVGIKQQARDFFYTLIPTPSKEQDYFALSNSVIIIPELELSLAKLANTTAPDENENHSITPELSTAVKIFLEEVILTLENYAKTAAPQDFEKTLAALHNALLSQSPSLINDLKLEQIIDLSAVMERAPQAALGLGAAVYAELNYELDQYPTNQSQELATQILATPVSEQLNYLGVCYKIITASVASGSKTNEHTLQIIDTILAEIISKTTFPIVRYTATSLQEIVLQDPETVAGMIHYSREVRDKTATDKAEILTDPTLLPFSSAAEQADALFLLQKLHQPLLRKFLENKFNLNLAEISLRDQLHFLQYASEKNSDTLERLALVFKNKSNLNKEHFLKSFFACATDKTNGDRLLSFAESTPEVVVNSVFSHYSNLVDTLTEVEEQVANFYAEKEKTVDSQAVVQEMSRRSSGILLKNIEHGKNVSQVDLEAELAKVEANVVLFASTFKIATKENPNLSFAEIKGFGVERVRGNELTDAQKQAMKKIFAQNYAAEPEFITRFHNFLYPPNEAGQALLAKNEFTIITQTVADKKSSEPKIVAFYRLENRGEELYFAANNVDPAWQSSGIGKAALKATFSELNPTKKIMATFPPDTAIGPVYIEQFGFVGTDFHLEMDKYPRFGMELSPNFKSDLRQKSIVGLSELVLPANTKATDIIAENLPSAVLQFTLPTESVAAHTAMKTLCDYGYQLTRYVVLDPKENKRWYGFEKTTEAKNST